MGKIFTVVSIDTDALTFAHYYPDGANADDKLLGLKVRHFLKSASQKTYKWFCQLLSYLNTCVFATK